MIELPLDVNGTQQFESCLTPEEEMAGELQREHTPPCHSVVHLDEHMLALKQWPKPNQGKQYF